METKVKTTYEVLLEPCANYLAQEGEKIDKKTGSKKLFFADFFKIIVFAFVGSVKTLKLLITELKSNPAAKVLGLEVMPYNTLLDGFHRFDFKYFEKIFFQILQSFQYKNVPELEELGVFRLIDGSLFPTFASIFWAEYKSKKNAIKLHLSFNLNRMIPAEFLVSTGKSCERSFLKNILQKDITYIADRGYFSFEVTHKIFKAFAFYIIRSKSNLVYTVKETFTVNSILPDCFYDVSDVRAKMDNDPFLQEVRIIEFKVDGSHFVLVTNRFDLTTLQVILLYAYRWQIELFFKFIKRSLGCIHLFNHSQNGVTVQFYIIMIVAVLQLKLKQECIENTEIQDDMQKTNNSVAPENLKENIKTNQLQTNIVGDESLQDNTQPNNSQENIVEDENMQKNNQSNKSQKNIVDTEYQMKSHNKNTQNTWQRDNLSKSLIETNVEEFTKQAIQKERKEYSSLIRETVLKADVWIKSVNRIFEKYWKISCHWLCKLKNFLALPFTEQIIKELAKYQ
jgi:hypothetical protein